MIRSSGRNKSVPTFLAIITCSSFVVISNAQERDQSVTEGEKPSPFIDKTDGMFDVSDYLTDPKAFLIVPMIITEPAVGYGLGINAVFIQPRQSAGGAGWSRPNISGVGGMRTENDTDGLLAYDLRYWNDGDFKSLAFGVSSSVNLDFYPPEIDGLDSKGFQYNLKNSGGRLSGEWTLPMEGFSFEASYSYFDFKVRLRDNETLPTNLPLQKNSIFSSVGLALKFDTRDNFFSPQSGYLSKTSISVNDRTIGASSDFHKISQVLIGYWPISDSWILGIKLQGEAISGDYPFYSKPFVDLRGIATMRFQGKYVAFSELELQYKLNDRYRLLGFAGAGKSWDKVVGLDFNQSTYSGGLGFRYRIARKFGLDAGIDIALSEDEEAIYLQFGGAWMRP